jgi:MFS family permease
MRSGLRFARHASELQAAIVRGFGFFLFASAPWALLPLVAKNLVNGGPQAFGLLVASIGVGAVAGAFALPGVRKKLPSDALVAAATLLYAAAIVAVATFSRLLPLCFAMVLSGVAWIAVLSSLQVAAQMALPSWVRSRGLAVFMATYMGSMALGSMLWGKVADIYSISGSLIIAAAGLAIAVLFTWRWKISGIEDVDLTPSMHWPTPIVDASVTPDRGPILVTIEYEVRKEAIHDFLEAIRTLGQHRRRDGAFAWSVFEHAEKPGHFIESFSIESWLDHLRQHERVTDADRVLQANIRTLLVEGHEPTVTHYVATIDAVAAAR